MIEIGKCRVKDGRFLYWSLLLSRSLWLWCTHCMRRARGYFLAPTLPYEAIKAGTTDAAKFLNQEKEFGTVAVGRRADLILLSANPLDDVANVAKRTGVMLRGEWLTEEKLQRRLRDVDGEQAAVSGHSSGR